jgi:hypothetical protein
MAEMPKEMKDMAALIAVAKILEVFGEMTEAGEVHPNPVVREFVKVYTDKVEESASALETVFGKGFMDK